MKRWMAVMGMVALAASTAWSQPRQGGPPGGSPGGGPHSPPPATMQRQQQQMEMATRTDRAMERMRDLERWMAEHATRSEWREWNRAMEQGMERLHAMDERIGKLADEPEFRNDRSRLMEMDRLQDRFRATAREMEESHEGIRRLVQEQRAQGGPAAASGDRDRLRERQRDLTKRTEALEERARELRTWMNANRTRGEWTATARDMDQVRDRLRTMIHQMDRLCEDPDMDRERLRDMDRLQDRLHVMTREMEEAHDALSGLTRGE